MKEDVLFFTYTESANFCDGVVGSSSFHNIPVDVERDVVPFEISNICTECGPLMILIQCVDVRIMLVEPDLHEIIG